MSYRARTIARELIDGYGKEQYTQLWSYAEEIRKTNPGSTFVVSVDRLTPSSSPTFCRAYMCFDACKKGLLSCGRPVICLDGCHLKGQCPGHLLTAVGIDANDGIYPIAVAVVESECTASWQWFLQLLLEDLQINGGSGWTFISDQQKGLVKTLNDLMPQAEIRFCLRHLYANFKKQFRGKLYKDVMMNASKATTEYYFEKELKKLLSVDKAAYMHLKGIDRKTWAKHAFSHVSKCDISLNKLSESFNALLLPARDKPIITMLETIRKLIMTRIAKRYKTMEECTELLCPKIKKKLRKMVNASRHWYPLAAGGDRFEVSDPNERYIVDLSTQTCTCSSWGLTGIPCVHAISCLLFMRKKVEEFVHPYYHRQTYLTMYSFFIHPINGPEKWPRTDMDPIMPPTFKRRPGRPKKKRVRDPDERQSQKVVSNKKKRMTCSKCQGSGHNNRTCNRDDTSSLSANVDSTVRERSGRGSARDTFMGFNSINDIRSHGSSFQDVRRS